MKSFFVCRLFFVCCNLFKLVYERFLIWVVIIFEYWYCLYLWIFIFWFVFWGMGLIRWSIIWWWWIGRLWFVLFGFFCCFILVWFFGSLRFYSIRFVLWSLRFGNRFWWLFVRCWFFIVYKFFGIGIGYLSVFRIWLYWRNGLEISIF